MRATISKDTTLTGVAGIATAFPVLRYFQMVFRSRTRAIGSLTSFRGQVMVFGGPTISISVFEIEAKRSAGSAGLTTSQLENSMSPT